MENNQLNFDPMTGQPLNPIPVNNANDNATNNTNYQNIVQPETNTQSIPSENSTLVQNDQIQNNEQLLIQSVPTVEQSTQDFINNTQNMTSEKKEEKKDTVNYTFILILFVIIMLVMYFLFPILLKYI